MSLYGKGTRPPCRQRPALIRDECVLLSCNDASRRGGTRPARSPPTRQASALPLRDRGAAIFFCALAEHLVGELHEKPAGASPAMETTSRRRRPRAREFPPSSHLACRRRRACRPPPCGLRDANRQCGRRRAPRTVIGDADRAAQLLRRPRRMPSLVIISRSRSGRSVWSEAQTLAEPGRVYPAHSRQALGSRAEHLLSVFPGIFALRRSQSFGRPGIATIKAPERQTASMPPRHVAEAPAPARHEGDVETIEPFEQHERGTSPAVPPARPKSTTCRRPPGARSAAACSSSLRPGRDHRQAVGEEDAVEVRPV